MKPIRLLKIFAVLLSTCGASSAFAGGRQPFILPVDCELNGVHLDAARYLLRWEGEGRDVKVSLMRGDQVVVTAPAALLLDPEPGPPTDTVRLAHRGASIAALTQIRLAGRRFVLRFPGATGTPADEQVARGGK